MSDEELIALVRENEPLFNNGRDDDYVFARSRLAKAAPALATLCESQAKEIDELRAELLGPCDSHPAGFVPTDWPTRRELLDERDALRAKLEAARVILAEAKKANEIQFSPSAILKAFADAINQLTQP